MAQQDEMFEGSIKRAPRATQTREKAATRKVGNSLEQMNIQILKPL